ncbi:MAG TPA: hypothetical protein VGA56_17045, partial [Opitutaceae bacterium]
MKPEESILADALEQPVADRGAFLDRACGAGPALRARVEALLRGYEGPGAEFELSPFAEAADIARGQSTSA